MENSISLNKFISNTGICSRREADKFISAGRVKINGVIARKGNRVLPDDEVLLDGQPVALKPRLVYLAFNKPVGITCTTDLKDRDNIIDFINYPGRIFPIGRLDKGSSGLILLTNDGDIVNRVLRAEGNHEKEYVVKVNQPITHEFIRRMSDGLPILGTTTNKCFVQAESDFVFRIILTQGLNRQIRRMCDFLGYRVTSLHRTRIINIHLGHLRRGAWRVLTHRELMALKKALS